MAGNTTILIIRHAEKPEPEDDSPGLSPAGQARAQAYRAYFQNYVFDSQPIKLDYLFAAADRHKSHRPRLTLEPLAQGLGLAVDSDYKYDDPEKLAAAILKKAEYDNRRILICWEHKKIPNLLKALGVDPAKLLPESNWPENIFGWTLHITYDNDGNLIQDRTVCSHQKLMYTDCSEETFSPRNKAARERS
ncbi:MAG: flagellar basal body-associated protein FliL [Candidatus Competibacteraceae bacterium]